jgi:hypothetical protein
LEKTAGGFLDFLKLFFLGRRETGIAKKEGGGIENLGERIFEFKRKPKENIGFIDRKIGGELFVFLVLKADKPSNGRNKSQGKKRDERNERVEGLGEEDN